MRGTLGEGGRPKKYFTQDADRDGFSNETPIFNNASSTSSAALSDIKAEQTPALITAAPQFPGKIAPEIQLQERGYSAGKDLSFSNSSNNLDMTSGGLIANKGVSASINGFIKDGSALGAVTKTVGALTLSGANTYAGGTTISGGTLQIGKDTARIDYGAPIPSEPTKTEGAFGLLGANYAAGTAVSGVQIPLPKVPCGSATVRSRKTVSRPGAANLIFRQWLPIWRQRLDCRRGPAQAKRIGDG